MLSCYSLNTDFISNNNTWYVLFNELHRMFNIVKERGYKKYPPLQLIGQGENYVNMDDNYIT